MNEQELNKKLIRWAGLPECKHWDNVGHDDRHCPDLIKFTEDETACFKWLVPKLNRDGWFINLMQAGENAYWKAQLWCPYNGTGTVSLESLRNRPVERDETPALALCLAIEKLINVESGDAERD